MRRLLAANLVPERAGQPVKVLAHISLADLMRLDGSSALQAQWTQQVRVGWAAHRARASVSGRDGGAWLDGDAAAAFACDASVTPVVIGEVNYPVLGDLVRLCAHLAQLPHPDPVDPAEAAGEAAGLQQQVLRIREALEQQIIGKTTILLLHSRSALDVR
jgi:hypothetical protein